MMRSAEARDEGGHSHACLAGAWCCQEEQRGTCGGAFSLAPLKLSWLAARSVLRVLLRRGPLHSPPGWALAAQVCAAQQSRCGKLASSGAAAAGGACAGATARLPAGLCVRRR